MFKYDCLAAFVRRKQMDPIQEVDSSAWQVRDRFARERSVGEECRDSRDGR